MIFDSRLKASAFAKARSKKDKAGYYVVAMPTNMISQAKEYGVYVAGCLGIGDKLLETWDKGVRQDG